MEKYVKPAIDVIDVNDDVVLTSGESSTPVVACSCNIIGFGGSSGGGGNPR